MILICSWHLKHIFYYALYSLEGGWGGESGGRVESVRGGEAACQAGTQSARFAGKGFSEFNNKAVVSYVQSLFMNHLKIEIQPNLNQIGGQYFSLFQIFNRQGYTTVAEVFSGNTYDNK